MKSIKKNLFLNIVKVFVLSIFPLVTFPYATRVLGIDNIGKIQFSLSVVSFFLLISTLGINSYAVREAAPIRNDRKKISKFASEIFSINIITSLLSYILLLLFILIIPKISNYSSIIWILSLQIIFTTVGLDWIYTVFEEYLYITLRSVIIQLISLVLMIVFVREPNDYYKYALIVVLSNTGVYLINYIHMKKYIDLSFTFKNNIKMHIKPLLILFSNEITQQVYVNSDMIMLGFITTDYYTGIYSVAVKVYTLVKKMLNSMIAVLIPRLAFYSSDDEKFSKLCSNIFNKHNVHDAYNVFDVYAF